MNKSINIYIVRHGETEFNIQKKIQGWCDSALTEKGIKQAEALAIGLKDISFKKAYSSSSQRAITTAKLIIKNKQIRLNASDCFKEMGFGSLEKGCASKLHKNQATFERGFCESGGEDYKMVKNRVLKGLDMIFSESENGDNILLVTHGATILVLISYLLQKPIESLTVENKPFENCSISKIVCENNKYKVCSFNDVSYRNLGLLE